MQVLQHRLVLQARPNRTAIGDARSDALAGNQLLIYNVAAATLNSVSLNGGALAGTPLSGVDSTGQIAAPPVSTALAAPSALSVAFAGDGGWIGDIAPLSGPPQPMMMLCMWNGYVVVDAAGELRLVSWN